MRINNVTVRMALSVMLRWNKEGVKFDNTVSGKENRV